MLVIEAIKEIPREKLEELYVLSLHREHEAIYRSNDLEKENKILRENAEHNDKVVDKLHWENVLLKGLKNNEK